MGVVAPFTNVNGRVWGGTPALSLRERGQGVEGKERRNIKDDEFSIRHKVHAFSEV